MKLFFFSLIKEHELRGSLEELIKHEFIEKYLNESVDLEFVGNIIDKIHADKEES